MVQSKLENLKNISPGFVSALVNSLKSTFAESMINQFGNYLCQKIIEVSSVKDLKLIVDSIKSKATEISLSVHGTRAMQTLVDVVSFNINDMENEC